MVIGANRDTRALQYIASSFRAVVLVSGLKPESSGAELNTVEELYIIVTLTWIERAPGRQILVGPPSCLKYLVLDF